MKRVIWAIHDNASVDDSVLSNVESHMTRDQLSDMRIKIYTILLDFRSESAAQRALMEKMLEIGYLLAHTYTEKELKDPT